MLPKISTDSYLVTHVLQSDDNVPKPPSYAYFQPSLILMAHLSPAQLHRHGHLGRAYIFGNR